MPKPDKAPNHGQQVSAYVHELQAARVPGEHPGLGKMVSEFARNGGEDTTPPPVDFEDGVIRVIKDGEGGEETFASFADALAYADDGDTIQVGAGVYAEAINLDENVTIIGEAGAILDASGITADAGTQATVQLFDGFSGGSISGLTIVAVDDGNGLVSIIGQAVTGITLSGNTFDAGANTIGSLVYLNPGVDGVTLDGNTFKGDVLASSPLLGVEGDNIAITDNTFGATPGGYAKVEVFPGNDGVVTDITLTGNTGLADGDVVGWP